MNICVLHRYPLGEIKGTNPSFPYFLQELTKRGKRVFLVTFAGKSVVPTTKNIEFYPLTFQFNRAHNLDKWLKSLLFIFIVPFKVRKLNLLYKLDIVYCDDSLPFYPYFTKLVSGLPTIMRLGDLQTAYLFYDRGSLGKLLYRVIHWFEKFTWKKIDRIVAICESFKRFLIKEGIKEDKISVVEESIDIDEFCNNISQNVVREKFGLKDEPVVMFHGLVASIKGLDVLLKAAPDILEEFPDFKIMIVGAGPDLSRLKQLSRVLNVDKSVIFTNWVPFREIPTYINACNVGIPLRNGNLGNNFVVTTALLQYWAAAKPIIAPRLQAVEDLINEGEDGFLFDPDDSRMLAQRVKYLLADTQLQQKFSRQGRNKVERYAATKIATQMVDILERGIS